MKYYDELDKLESKLIRLDTLTSTVSVLIAGLYEVNSKDMHNAMYFLESSLSDLNESIRADFDALWEAIRTDTLGTDEEVNFDDDEDDLIDFEDENGYNFQPLEDVTRVWAKN